MQEYLTYCCENHSQPSTVQGVCSPTESITLYMLTDHKQNLFAHITEEYQIVAMVLGAPRSLKPYFKKTEKAKLIKKSKYSSILQTTERQNPSGFRAI